MPGVPGGEPTRLLGPHDPLTSPEQSRANRARPNEAASTPPQPRIGYACMWEKDPERTWSYSAWNLLAALRLAADTTDIGVHFPPLPRRILRVLYGRLRNGRITTTWEFSRLTDAYIEHTLRRALSQPAARRCDAVLTIHDLATLPVPFFTYSDISWDAF